MTGYDKINEVARIIYATALGYTSRPGHDFLNSSHPMERACWNAAEKVWEEITGDSIDLSETLEEDD